MSRSRSRMRRRALNIRLHDHERDRLDAMGAQVGMHPADLVRAVFFGYPLKPACAQPCSAKHPQCNPQHRSLVEGYRDQLQRETLELEGRTGMHKGDIEFALAKGLRVTSFADWLRAHRRSDDDQ